MPGGRLPSTLDGRSMTAADHKTLNDEAVADIRTVEAILRRWDPIGVEPGSMAPADEYDSYAPYLVSMARNGCTLEEVTARLEYLASETMGLGPSTAQSREHSSKFAAQIIEAVQPSNKSLERTRER
ncbi:hypothetical protein OF001_U20007 [Pseudomonas sp. OF001]|nr:hypothetical protein OF001_U20007 [Pseudomonas sp. OF001]